MTVVSDQQSGCCRGIWIERTRLTWWYVQHERVMRGRDEQDIQLQMRETVNEGCRQGKDEVEGIEEAREEYKNTWKE